MIPNHDLFPECMPWATSAPRPPRKANMSQPNKIKPRRPAPPAKPVKLQINTTGAWRNVIDFDAYKPRQSSAAMKHGAALAGIAGGTCRVVLADGTQAALAHWTPEAGWIDSVTGKGF